VFLLIFFTTDFEKQWVQRHSDLFGEIRWMLLPLTVIVIVLLAVRLIYLRVNRLLYKKKLDIFMNNIIVILSVVDLGITSATAIGAFFKTWLEAWLAILLGCVIICFLVRLVNKYL
jgi:hypothetical protein